MDHPERVVIRRRLTAHTGPERYSDVLGHLVEDGPDTLVVRTADGTLVHVPRDEVHRMRRVPPPPARRVNAVELERVSSLGWPAPEQEWLGGWLLRAGGGVTSRANSVLPIGEPDRQFEDALTTVQAWYAARDLPAQIQLPLPDRADLDAALANRGWTTHRAALTLAGGLERAFDRLADRVDLPPVALEPAPAPDWLANYARYRGLDTVSPTTLRILTGAAMPVFAAYRVNGELLAMARGVVDLGWFGLSALDVRSDHRRRGVAGHVLRAMLAWARARDADRMYLQVDEENEPARTLYHRLGMVTHHRYHYRIR